jgi:uncharacterized protein (TIGR02594 family)
MLFRSIAVFTTKEQVVMVLIRTTNLLLLCAIGLVATPASARTLNKAPEISHASPQHRASVEFTDVSARRRHHVKRERARYVARRASVANSYASANQAGAVSDAGGGLVSEARRYIGGNPTGRRALWCGHFMNLVLERSGHRASSSNMARSFASYGTRISGPQVGAIAVMSRGKGGGHVGVVSGVDANGNPIIISGNHGRRVAETVYPRGRIYAYVMP